MRSTARIPSNMPERSLALLALDYPPGLGGIQTLTREIYGRLGDLTRLVVAPALAPGVAEDAGSLPPTRTRHGAGQGWSTLLYLREAAAKAARDRRPPCLLHCNHLFTGYAGWWLRRRHGLPFVVWGHGEEITRHQYPRWAGRMLADAAGIFVVSDFTAARMRELLPKARRLPPMVTVPLGARSVGAKPRSVTVMLVTPEGQPLLQFLDERGQVVQSLPQGAKS